MLTIARSLRTASSLRPSSTRIYKLQRSSRSPGLFVLGNDPFDIHQEVWIIEARLNAKTLVEVFSVMVQALSISVMAGQKSTALVPFALCARSQMVFAYSPILMATLSTPPAPRDWLWSPSALCSRSQIVLADSPILMATLSSPLLGVHSLFVRDRGQCLRTIRS